MNSALRKKRARERRQLILVEAICWTILVGMIAIVAPMLYRGLVFIMLF